MKNLIAFAILTAIPLISIAADSVSSDPANVSNRTPYSGGGKILASDVLEVYRNSKTTAIKIPQSTTTTTFSSNQESTLTISDNGDVYYQYIVGGVLRYNTLQCNISGGQCASRYTGYSAYAPINKAIYKPMPTGMVISGMTNSTPYSPAEQIEVLVPWVQ